MPDEFVVSSVKEAVKLAREGKSQESMKRYQTLFEAPQFQAAPLDDQRQALKLLLNPKTAGTDAPGDAGIAAYKAGIVALQRILLASSEPKDHELLGLAHLKSGDPVTAKKVFEEGLAIAHSRNDAEWAGQLLKRVSML